MEDAENVLHPSKKRAAGREISRDNPGDDDDDETSEQEIGTFKKASEEVLASRRIVKVRRSQTSSAQSAPSSNPFAGLRLIPPPVPVDPTSVVTVEAESCKSELKSDLSKVADVENNGDNKQLESECSEGKVYSSKGTDGENDVNKKLESGTGESKDEATAKEIISNEETKAETKQLESEADEPKGEATAATIKHNGETEKDAAVNKVEKKTEKDVGPETIEKEVEKTAVLQTGENENKEQVDNQNVEKSGEATIFSSFQQLSSSQNAFTGLTGTGFSGSSFSFGSITKDASPPSSVSGSLFGLKNDQSSFSFGLPSNGSSLFGTSGASTATKKEGSGFPAMQQVSLETGEENEKAVFVADAALFEFLDGSWKERGKGELKVNVPTTGTGKGRLVMRTRGNYRLILNASLYSDIKLTNMEKKGITFACVNSAGEGTAGLSTFALKFKDVVMVDEFRSCVMEHKGEVPAAALKTPENSPKAADD